MLHSLVDSAISEMYQKRNVPPLRIAKSSSKLSQEDTSEESFQNVVFFPVYMT